MIVLFVAFSIGLTGPAPSTIEGRQYADDDWIKENLSDRQISDVQQLVSQIVEGPSSPVDAAELTRQKVRRLSIREAAGLGIMLLNDHQIDPKSWLALPHAREREAAKRLTELQRRFGTQESGYRFLETTVQGSDRLQKLCGEQTLTEVTGVGFWTFAEGIAIPISLNDDDIDVVVDLPGLQWIDANWSQLTDKGVMRLGSLGQLRELRIADADISDRSLRSLGLNHNFCVLDISNATRVTDDGIDALSNCVEMENLNLRGTGVTSACLPALIGMPKLRSLSLGHTSVCASISTLGQLQGLRRLDLSGLGSTESPIASRELEFLSDLKQLQTIELRGTAVETLELIDLPELASLSLGHSTLKELTVVDLPKITDLGIASRYEESPLTLDRLRIRNLHGVRWLSIQGLTSEAADGLAAGMPTLPNIGALYLNGAMTDELSNGIGGLAMLRTLRISASVLADGHLRSIARAPKLSFLHVGGSSLTSGRLHELSGAENLVRLQLDDAILDEFSFLETLRPLGSLRLDGCEVRSLRLNASVRLPSLDVRQGAIDEISVADNESLSRLSLLDCDVQRLTIDSCNNFGNVFCGGESTIAYLRLRNLPKLASITFQEGTTLGEMKLASLPFLTGVTFWAAHVQLQHIEALEALPALTRLDISGTNLGDESADAVARLTTLERLDVSRHFTLDGLRRLTHLPNLQSLNLHRDQNSDWTRDTARRMFSHVKDVSVF